MIKIVIRIKPAKSKKTMSHLRLHAPNVHKLTRLPNLGKLWK